MKKSFLILLFPLILTGCDGNKDADHKCVDDDKDHYCDICEKKLSDCYDKDADGFCDWCGHDFSATVTGISVKKAPEKTNYHVGDYFDPKGMVINVDYSDGSHGKTTEYTYPKNQLKASDTSVTISYSGFTTTVAIKVTDKPDILEEYTQTIMFSGSDFGVVATEAGVQFDDSSYSRNVETLFAYCDSCLEYLNLVTSIECTSLNTCEWETGAALCVGTGYYAKDRFKAGEFKWNSEVKIYKVEIEARAYTKRNDYSGDIIDTPAVIHLDEKEQKLMEDSETTATVKSLSKEYPDGVNSFTISSTGARVALKQVKITWRG